MSEHLSEDFKNILLAGIGAAAVTVEKAKDLIDILVKKGELTMDQAKDLIDALTKKGELTVEQGKELIDALAKKGELTMDQGKDLIDALTKKGEVTMDQAKDLIDALIKKGQLTVDQGKVLNEELKHNIKAKVKEMPMPFIKNDPRASTEYVINNLDKLSKEELETIKMKLAAMERAADDGSEQ